MATMFPAIRDSQHPVKRIPLVVVCVLFGALLFLSVAHRVEAATPPSPSQSPDIKPKAFHLTLMPTLGIPDTSNVPFGGGIGLQGIWYPMVRFGFGGQLAWSTHTPAHFFRAAFVLQVLIDDLAVKPFLETGIGLQIRLMQGEWLWTPDLHLGFGVDIPIASLPWLFLGTTFQIYFPIDVLGFPITKSLHIRLRLLF